MFCNNRTNRTEMCFVFFLNLQFPAKNFWGRCNALQVIDFRKQHPRAARRATLRRMGGAGGAMTGRETRSTRGVGCFRGRSKTWQRWFCQLPSMFLGISMFLQVKLGGRISRPAVVNDDFQVVSGIHKLEPVVVRPVRGCMFKPISRCFIQQYVL